MAVEKANGGAGMTFEAEVLSLDALPAVLDQIYAHACARGVTIDRISGKPTPEGVVLMALGHPQ